MRPSTSVRKVELGSGEAPKGLMDQYDSGFLGSADPCRPEPFTRVKCCREKKTTLPRSPILDVLLLGVSQHDGQRQSEGIEVRLEHLHVLGRGVDDLETHSVVPAHNLPLP